MAEEKELEGSERVCLEVAENDFERFCEANGIDLDTDGFTEEDMKSLEDCKRKIIKAIMAGRLEINDAAEAVVKYETSKGDSGEVVFSEPEGAALTAMDRVKKGHDVQATYAVMGAITKKPPQLFNSMRLRDSKLCGAILMLFLGS